MKAVTAPDTADTRRKNSTYNESKGLHPAMTSTAWASTNHFSLTLASSVNRFPTFSWLSILHAQQLLPHADIHRKLSRIQATDVAG
jgi:hypothetical protein